MQRASLTRFNPPFNRAASRQRDGHLLDDVEVALLACFTSLPRAPLSLLLRLLLRRRVWHPVASIAYSDVPDAAAAAEELAEAGLAVLDDTIRFGADLHALLEGLPAETLKGALTQLAPARHPAVAGAAASGSSKAALVSAAMVSDARFVKGMCAACLSCLSRGQHALRPH